MLDNDLNSRNQQPQEALWEHFGIEVAHLESSHKYYNKLKKELVDGFRGPANNDRSQFTCQMITLFNVALWALHEILVAILSHRF